MKQPNKATKEFIAFREKVVAEHIKICKALDSRLLKGTLNKNIILHLAIDNVKRDMPVQRYD